MQELRGRPDSEESYGLLTYHLACAEDLQVIRQFERLIDCRHSVVGPLLRLIQALHPNWDMAAITNRLRLPEIRARAVASGTTAL